MEESLQLRSLIQSFLQTQREEQAIIESAFKDVRKSLAALQSAFALAGETMEMENDVCEVFAGMSQPTIKSLMKQPQASRNEDSLSTFEEVLEVGNILDYEGASDQDTSADDAYKVLDGTTISIAACISENVAYNVFDEMLKPPLTGHVDDKFESHLKSNEKLQHSAEKSSEMEQPFGVKIRSVRIDHQLFDQMPEPSLVEQNNGMRPTIGSLRILGCTFIDSNGVKQDFGTMPSNSNVELWVGKVFAELTKPMPTGLQSVSSLHKMSAAIFTTAKAGNCLFEEAGEPHLLTMASLKAVHHLFDEMPELTSVEQDKECELNISHLMLVPRLDIEFLLGAISRFVFDPGGSFLYHKGCHSFKSGGDKYDFDFCFGELNTGPGCTSIDNALKMESIVVSSSSSKTRLHVAATGYPILYLSHVQTNWPTEEQPCVVSYIFYSCICRFQDEDSGTIVAFTYVDLIVAYINHERLMLPVVDYQRVWFLIKMFTASKTSKVFVTNSGSKTNATLARTLSYASMPIGDILVSPEDADVVYSQSNKFGSFSHGFTYSGYHVSCAFSIIAKFGRGLKLDKSMQREIQAAFRAPLWLVVHHLFHAKMQQPIVLFNRRRIMEKCSSLLSYSTVVNRSQNGKVSGLFEKWCRFEVDCNGGIQIVMITVGAMMGGITFVMEIEDCSFIIKVENFIWDPGWCLIFLHHLYILGDKDVFKREGRRICIGDKGIEDMICIDDKGIEDMICIDDKGIEDIICIDDIW